MLRRWVATIATSADTVRALRFHELIRVGSDQGLLKGDWPVWCGYREMRAADRSVASGLHGVLA